MKEEEEKKSGADTTNWLPPPPFFFLKKYKKSKSIKRIGLDTKFSTGELLFFSLLFGSVDEKFNNKKLNTKKKNKKTFLRTSSGNVIQLRERYDDIIRESCCFVVSWMRIRPPFHFTCIIDTHWPIRRKGPSKYYTEKLSQETVFYRNRPHTQRRRK